MIRRMTTVFSFAAALLLPPGAAAAQESVSADGEFHWVFEVTNEIIFMVQSRLPTAEPSGPVEVWVWTFYQALEDMPSFGNRDSMAVLTRVDCEASTGEGLRYEGFLGDVFIGAFRRPGWAAPSTPGTASSEIVRVACEPGFGEGLQTFPDLGDARAAARAHFAEDYP